MERSLFAEEGIPLKGLSGTQECVLWEGWGGKLPGMSPQ